MATAMNATCGAKLLKCTSNICTLYMIGLKIKPEWLAEQQIKVYSDLMLQIKNDKNF